MKNSRPVLLSRPAVIAGLIMSVVLAVGTALLSTVSTRDIAVAGARVAHTQETLLEINQLLSSIIDAETGQRGYILTGLDSYLEPYTRAAARLDEQLAQLRVRFNDSPEQNATLGRISRLVDEKKSELARTIELRRTNAAGPALHVVDSGEGLKTMNALRDAVHQLEQGELSALARHSALVGQRARFFQFVSVGMLVVACLLGGAGAVLFMRRMHELETMITVCAWTKRVKFKGRWVSFEEYLHTRFNLRFTHGISEEASRKLQMEAVELVEADPSKFRLRPGFIPPAPEPSSPGP
ncbi:MAG TPA: CHASE3 domain-containing protein [Rariglobus sp.]